MGCHILCSKGYSMQWISPYNCSAAMHLRWWHEGAILRLLVAINAHIYPLLLLISLQGCKISFRNILYRMSTFVMRCDISMLVTYPGLKVTLTTPPPLHTYTHTHTHTHTYTHLSSWFWVYPWYMLYNQWCFSLPWINLPISSQQFKYLPTPRIWVWTDVLCFPLQHNCEKGRIMVCVLLDNDSAVAQFMFHI